MATLANILEWVQLGMWTLLALVAVNVWRRRRDPSATWLALTFASLAVVVLAGRFATNLEDDTLLALIETKILIAVLVLFPYLLYRFVYSLVRSPRWEWITANVLTEVVLLGTLITPRFPQPDEPQPAWLRFYVGVLAVQWVFLLGSVALRLWRAGREQPTVARMRIRTMSAGAFLLAVVIVFSAFGSSGDEVSGPRIAIQALGLLSGPLFLVGFAPPRLLRLQWRSRDELALREMEIGLVRSLSRVEIAEALLPGVVNFVGGSGAALFEPDGTVIASYRYTEEELEGAMKTLPAVLEKYEPVTSGSSRAILMENGWLVVTIGPYTPFFGTEELQMLSATAVLADLALGRARLFELERQSREAMRDFVAIASHDLRTPVTVIQGLTDLMGTEWDNLPDEQKQSFMEAIGRQIGHLDRLIRDLLTVSKLDVQEVEVLPQQVDMVEAARDAARSIAPDKKIKVWSSGNAVAFADPDHVARMLENYVRNAIVYGAAPIELDVQGQHRWVVVRVRDAGPGVPESFVPKLFEKFARVDKKKSKAVQGTGLGLSIVRGLARANGGYAWYEHNEPKGACFALRLPRVEAKSKRSAKKG